MPRCQEALEGAHGDEEVALRALLASGEVAPLELDAEALPDWVFTEAQLARVRALMGEMAIPVELKAFFEATLGQVGAEDRRRAGLRERAAQEAEESADPTLAGRRLEDLGFGDLEWSDGSWWGHGRLAGFYGRVPLEVEAPGGELPSDGQRRAYQRLEALDAGFRAVLEALLVGFYEGLRAARPGRLEPVGEPSDIWQRLDGPVLVLPRDADEAARAWLHFRRVGGGSKRIVVELREGLLRGIHLA